MLFSSTDFLDSAVGQDDASTMAASNNNNDSKTTAMMTSDSKQKQLLQSLKETVASIRDIVRGKLVHRRAYREDPRPEFHPSTLA